MPPKASKEELEARMKELNKWAEGLPMNDLAFAMLWLLLRTSCYISIFFNSQYEELLRLVSQAIVPSYVPDSFFESISTWLTVMSSPEVFHGTLVVVGTDRVGVNWAT
jgi:hypothetical protein